MGHSALPGVASTTVVPHRGAAALANGWSHEEGRAGYSFGVQERLHTLLPKLRPPRLGPEVLERPRLLARLDDGIAKPLTLVAAPAGYGKTTLLAQWIEHQDRPVAWLTLDEGDNDADVLVEEMVAAVRTVFPDSCKHVEALLARPGLPPVKSVEPGVGERPG